MNAVTLLKHFNRISEAPDAVARLRRFILDLAVRGKLVEQDPDDEPASELWKKIQVEKDHLVKGKKIKKQAPLPTVKGDEQSFQLPEIWIWCRLGDIGDWGAGSTPPRGDNEYYGDDFAWLKSGELGDTLALRGSEERVSKLALEKCSFRLNQPGDVLIAMYGATIGKLAILAEAAVTNQAVCGCTPFNGVFNKYLFLFLRSRREDFHGQSEGGAQPNISKVKIVSSHFALPPLAEQHRIVAKVDELMALCDQLEAARNEREAQRDRLTAASLHRIDTVPSTTLPEVARFHLDHLPRLTTRVEHIKQLRQTILNLAVRGRLVPQDPNDEPAAELLKRVEVERADLVKSGRIRKEKTLSPISTENLSFNVPKLWAWAKIGDAALFTEYGTSQQSNHSDTGVPVLKMGDIQGGRLLLGGQKKVPETIDDLPNLYLENGDLLYNRTNSAELVGKTGIYVGNDDEYTFASYLIRIRFSKISTSPEYFNIAMNSSWFRETQIVPHLKQQCGQANVNGTILKSMLIPFPPLAEQHRIVAKVDELMALCDQLEAQLTTTETDSRRLLEAVLRDALGNSDVRQQMLPLRSLSQAEPSAAKGRRIQKEGVESCSSISMIDQVEPKPLAASRNIPGAILAHLNPGREYSRAEILTAIDLSEADWTWAIRQLKAEGRVVQKGEKRGAKYLLV